MPESSNWVRGVSDYLHESPLSLTLDGITVLSEPRDYSSFANLESLSGWWDGVERRAETVNRPEADGELEGRVFLTGRTITASGLIVRPTRPELIQEMTRFGSVLSRKNRYGNLVIKEAELGLTRQCRVRMSAAPTISPLSDREARWSWVMRAADPIKYSVEESSLTLARGGAAKSLFNAGDTDVPLSVELQGPLAAPITVKVGSTSWVLSRDIAAGEKVIAYWFNREVWSGSLSIRFWQSGPWKWAEPGNTSVSMTAASGTGTAVVKWRSGWL